MWMPKKLVYGLTSNVGSRMTGVGEDFSRATIDAEPLTT
jgi:hypothetical protein